jgi:hypothetical protein
MEIALEALSRTALLLATLKEWTVTREATMEKTAELCA